MENTLENFWKDNEELTLPVILWIRRRKIQMDTNKKEWGEKNNEETHKTRKKNPQQQTQPEVVTLWAMRVKNLSPVDCNFKNLNGNIISNLPVLVPQLFSCSLKNLLVACLSDFLRGQEIGSFAVFNQY